MKLCLRGEVTKVGEHLSAGGQRNAIRDLKQHATVPNGQPPHPQ